MPIAVLLAAVMLWSATAVAQNAPSYSGDFTAAVQGGTLQLTLTQPNAGSVAGRLQGLGGTTFELQGEVRPDGSMVGIAKGQSGGLFFSGQLSGSQLQMIFAEPDWSGKPNLASARNLVFARASAQAPGSAAAAAPPGGQDHLLQGMLCSFAGSSGAGGLYSHSNRAYFDGRGGFTYGSETTSSTYGDPTRSSRYGGSVYAHSGGNRGRYHVAGNQVQLTFPDGSTDVASVHYRQPDGRITELKYDGKLYGQGLCD